MSNDWKVGDEAVCIYKGPWMNVFTGVLFGGPSWMSIHKVVHVHYCEQTKAVGLGFKEFDHALFISHYFRKPEKLETDHEDQEVIDIMSGKKIKETEPA